MHARKLLPVLAALLTAASASGIVDELAAGWKLALRPRALGGNVQPFEEALGGVEAPAITKTQDDRRPYGVEGDTFTDFGSAADRACDTQKNGCADLANGQNRPAFTVGDCDRQNERCKSAAASATDTAFSVLVSEDAQFEYFCDP